MPPHLSLRLYRGTQPDPAKYWLGLTATPYRRDQLDDLIYRQASSNVGRITRPHPGKTAATVHDYHDVLTPVIASSLSKRALGYTTLGFPDPRKLQN
ncbi:hypothetical protein ACQP1G_34930 [Nocardia sp. CA-107356]|uniref:hypothetical protein n=1 Tax=Nocardia sp. CA-107356 TaxID=3239972 RepID=UPI003D92D256